VEGSMEISKSPASRISLARSTSHSCCERPSVWTSAVWSSRMSFLPRRTRLRPLHTP
jgi:hypothetical protein